jgi:hypothetical protein
MNRPWWESPVCWLCDYGMFAMIFLLILLFGLYRYQFGTPVAAPPVMPPVPTSTSVTPVSTNAPLPTKTLPVPAVTSTPVNDRPEFILVFVPVNWKSEISIYQDASQNQAQIFMRETNIERYFTVTVVILEQGIENIAMDSTDIVYDIVEFAVQKQAGDRYIGLTDGDLSPGGDSSVVGWTSGGSAMVVEYPDEYVVAHELGHTFGLCDEYSYTEWNRQNSEFAMGCPNPYPEHCPQVDSSTVDCDGERASDGSNSIMGPAGLAGEYSFNKSCSMHLRTMFEVLTIGVTQ